MVINYTPLNAKFTLKLYKLMEDNMLSPTDIIEIALQALPYPQHIERIELDDNGNVRFTWRDSRFQVSPSLSVDEVGDGFLTGSNLAIAVQGLLEHRRLYRDIENSRLSVAT